MLDSRDKFNELDNPIGNYKYVINNYLIKKKGKKMIGKSYGVKFCYVWIFAGPLEDSNN